MKSKSSRCQKQNFGSIQTEILHFLSTVGLKKSCYCEYSLPDGFTCRASWLENTLERRLYYLGFVCSFYDALSFIIFNFNQHDNAIPKYSYYLQPCYKFFILRQYYGRLTLHTTLLLTLQTLGFKKLIHVSYFYTITLSMNIVILSLILYSTYYCSQ